MTDLALISVAPLVVALTCVFIRLVGEANARRVLSRIPRPQGRGRS
jgi:hypothetical protein